MALLQNSNKICSVLGCEHKVYAKGLCESHWKKANRAGTPIEMELQEFVSVDQDTLERVCEKGIVLKELRDLALMMIEKRPKSNIKDWIEQNVILPPGEGKDGNRQVSFDDFPHIEKVLQTVVSGVTRKVHLCCSSQSGKTIMAMALCVYFLKEKKLSGMYNLPADSLISRFVEGRLIPTLQASGLVVMKWDKTARVIYFDNGCRLAIGLLSQPATLAESSFPFVIDDEIDEVKTWQPDPIELSDNRLNAFKRSIHIVMSTPKLTSEHGIAERHKVSKKFELAIDCECGEQFEIIFPQVFRWPKDAKWYDVQANGLGWIECPHCGKKYRDKDHEKNVRERQVWIDKDSGIPPINVSFRVRRWNTIFKNYSEIIARYLQVKDDPFKLMDFNNSWKAEPEETNVVSVITDYDKFRENFSRNKKEIPAWSEYITAGVDMGLHELWLVLYAWGLGNRTAPFFSCRVDISGEDDASIESALNEMELITRMEDFTHLGNKEVFLRKAAIDCGYHTQNVYKFCQEQGFVFDDPHGLWVPAKGDRLRKSLLYTEGNADPENKHKGAFRGLKIILHQTHDIQEMLHRRLSSKPRTKGSIAFAMDEGLREGESEIKGKPRLFRHLDAVSRKEVMVKGYQQIVWDKKSNKSEDHLRDAMGNAELAGRMVGLHEIQDVEIEPVVVEREQQPDDWAGSRRL